jgi:hypothetical protein
MKSTPLLRLLFGMVWLLVAFPAFSQSEAESSQNTVRVSDPNSGKRWDMHPRAMTRLKTQAGVRHHGRIEAIGDSTITVRSQEIPVRDIASMRLTDSRKSRVGLITLLIGTLSIFLFFISVALLFGYTPLAIPLFLAYLIGGLILVGPIFYLVGILLIMTSGVHYSRSRGWKMEIRKASSWIKRNKVSRVEQM